MKRLQLTHSRRAYERYYLIPGSMGSHGCPPNHANKRYQVANGIDIGNGYQGYMSIDYFLKAEYIPQSAKDKLIQFLKENNLIYN